MTKPKVVIDARMVGPIPHGISRFVVSIVKALLDAPSLSFEPVFLIQMGMEESFGGFKTVVVRTPFLDPKEIGILPYILWKEKAKLYHSPSFSSLLAAPCPWVQTLHDLNHLTYGTLPEKIYYQTLLKPFAMKAKVLQTVSNFSKQEIEKWLLPANKEIQTIFNPIELKLFRVTHLEEEKKTLLDYGLESQKYFISLSNTKPHKNLNFLVRAFLKWREFTGSSIKLVLSVKEYSNEPGVVSLGGVSDPVAKILMKNALALTFPSLYEGFGIPPLEGAQLGTKLIVSSISSHREVLRDLKPNEVYYANPEIMEEWIKAFQLAYEGKLMPVGDQSLELLNQRYSPALFSKLMIHFYEKGLSS